jgi:hypothetical protein
VAGKKLKNYDTENLKEMNEFKILGYCLTLFFLLNFGNSPVFAQDCDVDLEELISGHVFHVNNLLYSNLSFIRQTGNENSVVTIQEQQGLLSNFVSVEQLNQGNNAWIEQTGSGHGARLLQNGSGNEANLWSVGSLSLTVAKQEGEGNLINSYIDNQKLLPKGALLLQNGNNNSIEFALLGNDGFWKDSWPRAAYIKQNGNDLEVSALFDSYSWPVYIEQQSGPGGAGMKVNVSTTDFSFFMKK